MINFKLDVNLREGGHHSGNWGGLLRNPGVVLASAIASMVDANGRILVEGIRPPEVPQAVRRADVTPKDFHDYWLNSHGPKVRGHAQAIRAKPPSG